MSYAIVDGKNKISEILQWLLQEKEISVAELARRTHLKQPTIQRIASGKYQKPHRKTLKPLADFFDITVNQLLGIESIAWLTAPNNTINRIPLISSAQATLWPNFSTETIFQTILIDTKVGKNTYAITMPDSSMEPLFPEGSILIIDPAKEPKDRCYVVIKLKNYNEIIFRQLLIDGKERYIKPLSPDFDRFKMAMLTSCDIIMGVLIQARLDYGN